eukprot:4570290-Prymnesium_polylepis.1
MTIIPYHPYKTPFSDSHGRARGSLSYVFTRGPTVHCVAVRMTVTVLSFYTSVMGGDGLPEAHGFNRCLRTHITNLRCIVITNLRSPA